MFDLLAQFFLEAAQNADFNPHAAIEFHYSFITAAVAAGTSLLGGFFGKGIRNQQKDILKTLAQAGTEIGIPSLRQSQDFFASVLSGENLSPENLQILQQIQDRIPEILPALQNAAADLQGSMPPEIMNSIVRNINDFQQVGQSAQGVFNAGGFTPETRASFQNLNNLATGNTAEQRSVRDSSFRMIAKDGRTQGVNQAFDTAMQLRAGDPRIDELLNVAGGVIGNMGQTPESRQFLGDLQGVIGQNGMTPDLQRDLGRARQIIDSGGFTPELRGILGNLQQQVSQGGLTPEARRLLGPLTQIVENGGRGGALMDFNNAISFARDEAAAQFRGGQEAARRAAIQRAGGASGIVGSGLQERRLGQFNDQALLGRAAAVRDAARSQQGLQLQQLLGAGQVSAGILDSANRIVSQAMSTQGQVAGAAASSLSAGLGAVQGLQGVAANRFNSAIAGANNVMANDNARLGQFVGLAETGLGLQLDRLKSAGQLFLGSDAQATQNLSTAFDALGQQGQLRTQAGLGAGQVAGQAAGRGLDALNIAGNAFGGVGTANNQLINLRGQNIQNAQFGLGLQNDLLQSGLNSAQFADSQLFGAGQNLMSLGQGVLGTQGQGLPNQFGPSPLATGVGNALSVFGDFLGSRAPAPPPPTFPSFNAGNFRAADPTTFGGGFNFAG